MAKSPSIVGVQFILGNADTCFGEEIRVVGSNAALGSWNPQHSVALSTDSKAYPRWSTTQIVWLLVVEGKATQLEYKYLRDRRALGKGIDWEERIANRRIVLPIEGSTSAGTANPMAAVWLVKDHAWDTRIEVVPMAVAEPQQRQAHDGSPEKTGDVSPPVGEKDFIPSWRAFSSENLQCENLELQRRNSASRLEEPPMDVIMGGTVHESCSSTGVHRTQSCHSVATEGDAVMGGTPMPRMYRELSFCSLGLHKPGELQTSEASTSDVALAEGSQESLPPALEVTQAPQAPPPKPGTFEEKYEVIGDSPLGEGTFGLVWPCRSRRGAGQGMMAVKRILMSKLLPRDVRNLFGHDDREGEIKMHQNLNHPHVIRLHEVFRAFGEVSLVMECCCGGDLFDLIASHNSGLPERTAAPIVRHLLRALAYLHTQRIVHRDVKCENILMLEKGGAIEKNTFKLCDFGFAARLGKDGQLSTRMGSPDNVAPEIVIGDRYSTPVDCWASGVLLYMALSARPPFWAHTDREVLRKVRSGEYSVSGGVWDQTSPAAKDLVCRLMTYSPRARITAAGALTHQWLAD